MGNGNISMPLSLMKKIMYVLVLQLSASKKCDILFSKTKEDRKNGIGYRYENIWARI